MKGTAGRSRLMAVAVLALVLLAVGLAAGCGQDYEPPESTATGGDAAPVGQVLDVDVELPHLSFPGRPAGVGARLDVKLALPTGTDGAHQAEVTHVEGRVEGEPVDVEDVSSGKTTVTISGGAWTTGRIGPISIEGVGFEYALRGRLQEDGWVVAGASWESQTGLEGEFVGWRRHRFMVVGTDYIAAGRGEVVGLKRESELSARHGVVRTSSDPVVSRTGGSLFVVNRLSFDNVQRLDPSDGFATSWQSRVGAGSNPQDVLVVGEGDRKSVV